MAFDSFRQRLARMIAPPKKGARMYAGARVSRLTLDWTPMSGSADSELWSSLTNLRNRSRALIRDNAYAKRAKLLVVNNVVGAGITMEAQVRFRDGRLNERVNDGIERAWDEWSRAENCHTGGHLHFPDFERQIIGQVFEAGEVLPRKHLARFGSSRIPLALELIEAERLADDLVTPVSGATRNYRMGVDRDEFGRAITYWLRKYHPGEFRYASGADDPNTLIGVAASEIFHLYICDRWPQTRGEPWLHTAMRRLNDMDGYAEAEIVRARAAACRVGIIQTPDENGLPNDNAPTDANGNPLQPQFDLEPGAVQRLAPGETWVDSDPSSPNAAADPFMRLLLREVAAGIGVSYASMSMDYSQSNYSSSRLALLDDRDLWKVLQQWHVRSFREPLHREWLRQAVMSGAIPEITIADYMADTRRFEEVSFKPRGWSWIDPEKEVNAFIAARRAGFISTSQIIALTGGGVDRDGMWKEIAQENKEAQAAGLVLTSDADQVLARGESDPDKEMKQAMATKPEPPQESAQDVQRSAEHREFVGSVQRAVEQMAGINDAIRDKQPIEVNIAPQPVHINTPEVKVDVAAPVVNVEAAPAPVVNVTTPEVKVDVAAPTVNVEAPTVNVEAPPQPIVNVTTPEVKVDVAAPQIHMPEQPINVTTPDVKVDVAAPNVHVEMPAPPPPKEVDRVEILERDGNRLARVIRTDRGDFEVVERDANGDAKIVKRRNAA